MSGRDLAVNPSVNLSTVLVAWGSSLNLQRGHGIALQLERHSPRAFAFRLQVPFRIRSALPTLILSGKIGTRVLLDIEPPKSGPHHAWRLLDTLGYLVRACYMQYIVRVPFHTPVHRSQRSYSHPRTRAYVLVLYLGSCPF